MSDEATQLRQLTMEAIELRQRLTRADELLDAAYLSLGKATLHAEKRLDHVIAVRQELQRSAEFVGQLLRLCRSSRETATMEGWISTDAVEELVGHFLNQAAGTAPAVNQ